MTNFKIPTWPNYSEEEAAAIAQLLLSNKVNYWTGSEGREFEKEFAHWINCDHAIAVANGTLALDLALHGLRIGLHNGGSAEDEVIVTPRSFIASVSCVVNAGAIPIFADVELDSGNISPTTIKPHISDNTRAIIPVHLAGWPCDMHGIMKLAQQEDIKVIEDCAQAHGAKINGKSVGSFGHAAAWSFCQDKIMTTGGEGGMVTTNDPDLWSRMWSFKDHGKSWDAVYNRDHAPGFRWLHESIGTNWRMLEIQARIGRIQLKKMSHWTRRRQEIAAALDKTLLKYSPLVRVSSVPKEYQHAYYRFYAYLDINLLPGGWSRNRIIQEICELGIPAFHGSCSEIYLEKAFENLPCKPPKRLPVAKRLGEQSIMFLTHPNITNEQLNEICEMLDHIFSTI